MIQRTNNEVKSGLQSTQEYSVASKVYDLYVLPVCLQILRNQSSMTMFRRVLAAKEASPVHKILWNFAFDLALRHQ